MVAFLGVALLFAAYLFTIFAPPWILAWLPVSYKPVTARYIHAETTGLSDWIAVDNGSREDVIFHPQSNPEAVRTLAYLTGQCNSGEGDFIFGTLPGDDRGDVRIHIKGKIDPMDKVLLPFGDGYKFFILEDWFIEVPFRTGPNNRGVSRIVSDASEAKCKDSSLNKHFRKGW